MSTQIHTQDAIRTLTNAFAPMNCLIMAARKGCFSFTLVNEHGIARHSERLYPDPQWRRLAAVWRAMYPVEGVPPRLAAALADLEATIPDLVTMLVGHRPFPLGGHRLGAVLRNPEVCRDALQRRFAAWRAEPDGMHRAPPTVAFAVLGQARASGLLTPEREARLLRRLITDWAVTSTLATARAATRADVPMFVGQPAIWADGTSRPDHLRNVI